MIFDKNHRDFHPFLSNKQLKFLHSSFCDFSAVQSWIFVFERSFFLQNFVSLALDSANAKHSKYLHNSELWRYLEKFWICKWTEIYNQMYNCLWQM